VIGDFLGDPFELLAGPGVGREGDEPVTELGNAEAPTTPSLCRCP
jgi:hypothetical protein